MPDLCFATSIIFLIIKDIMFDEKTNQYTYAYHYKSDCNEVILPTTFGGMFRLKIPKQLTFTCETIDGVFHYADKLDLIHALTTNNLFKLDGLVKSPFHPQPDENIAKIFIFSSLFC